jgi:hypothetical protein
LNDVLVKACANDPSKRYASAAQMRDDVAALERGERRPREKSPVRMAAAAVLCILLIAGIAFSIWSRSRAPAMIDLNLQTTIRTEPPGALVLLDDHVKKSPATFDELEPRKYKLRVMSPGYDPIDTTVDLGKKSFEPPVFVWRAAKAHWMFNLIRPERSLLCATRTARFRALELRRKKLSIFRPVSTRSLRSEAIGKCATALRSSAARLLENHSRLLMEL